MSTDEPLKESQELESLRESCKLLATNRERANAEIVRLQKELAALTAEREYFKDCYKHEVLKVELELHPYIERHAEYTAKVERQLETARAALEMLLRAYDSVLPGLRYIAVQDYALLNDAPIAARAALSAPENTNATR